MEDITHLIGHVLEHSVEDTLYLIPFLFVTYLAMEWLEHKAGDKAEEAVRRAGAAGPVVGALVGIVPQCGFSAAAATLWAGRVITLGTLFAVFLSTSDEMLPIFLAEQVAPMTILKIMGVKLMIGMVMGFVVDAAVRLARRDRERLRIHELCERDRCHCNSDCDACEQQPELAYDYEHDEEHEHHHEGGSILRSALKHTVQVTVFIPCARRRAGAGRRRCARRVFGQQPGAFRAGQRVGGPYPELRGKRGDRAALRRGRARRGRHDGGPSGVGRRGPAGAVPH